VYDERYQTLLESVFVLWMYNFKKHLPLFKKLVQDTFSPGIFAEQEVICIVEYFDAILLVDCYIFYQFLHFFILHC